MNCEASVICEVGLVLVLDYYMGICDKGGGLLWWIWWEEVRRFRYKITPICSKMGFRYGVLAPNVASGPKVLELKAKVEAEQHALRQLQVCLKDVCNRLLYDKRFSAFHYPVSEEDAPNYHTIIQHPIDVAKLQQNVAGQYIHLLHSCKMLIL
ncbi:hypothetical protein ACE6H2_020352 [Prunus campanulata]